MCGASVWAQDTPEKLDCSIDLAQWAVGTTRTYQGSITLEHDRSEESLSIDFDWTLASVETTQGGGYVMEFRAGDGFSFQAFDPYLSYTLQGHINTPPAMPKPVNIRYRISKKGDIMTLYNLEEAVRYFAPYYLHLRGMVESKVQNLELRERLVSAINSRLGTNGIKTLYDQFIGPVHAWYGQTLVVDQPLVRQVPGSMEVDGIGLVYYSTITTTPERKGQWDISRNDQLLTRAAQEPLREFYFGESRDRGSKETFAQLLASSSFSYWHKWDWKYDAKQTVVTEFAFQNRQQVELITEEEGRYYRLSYSAKLKQ